jgi:hypothetical protein
MDSQIGSGSTVTIQGRHEAAIAIVVPLDEVKIATGMTGDQLIHPAEGVPHRFVGRRQRGPAKVENIAAQDKRLGPSGGSVNRNLMSRRLRAAGAEVQVGNKVSGHVSSQLQLIAYGSN